jgi:hypothetical protein
MAIRSDITSMLIKELTALLQLIFFEMVYEIMPLVNKRGVW